MSWPEGWQRQDIGKFPGATDGNQHVWIDDGQIKTYGAVNVPVKVISILLAVVQEEPESAMWEAHMIMWTESERGWGQRPDGVSLHENKKDAAQFVKEYWERERARNKSAGITGVPDEYSRPDDEGARVLVSTELLERIRESGNGIRLWQGAYHSLLREEEIQR